MDMIQILSQELGIRPQQTEAAVRLIDEGNTIPFIARYRKEVTDSLDDTVLRQLDDRLSYLRNLQKRREEVLASIEEQGKLTEELAQAIGGAATLAEVEDLYRPYKPKRKTRASMAREKGLQPLAELILAQQTLAEPASLAQDYVNPAKGVETSEDALAGALDIIAETISDDADYRKLLRGWLVRTGTLKTKAATEQDSVYAMYYEFEEPVGKIANHRVLAINRGEKEGMLKVEIAADHEQGVEQLVRRVVRAKNACGQAVAAAGADAYKRLIYPSLENEVRSMLFETASEQAIKVFSVNLHHLLMQPPVKDRVVLGVDPGYRTGCKLAVVDETGKVLDTGVIYPTIKSDRKYEEAKVFVKALIKKHGVTLISIGNGTASKESEIFVAEVITELGAAGLSYMVVSEAGASVYSASKLAAAEFPEYDVSLRSAVSIARRLQDPLAELVKIDPKAIGIGQYQHDMPPARLDQSLGGVVESCVNSVGVDLNTASVSLLEHVAGVNSSVAKNIVAFREQEGRFGTRKQLLKVPKLGKKAFEQCAGFLRITDGDILDATAVHPESYPAAKLLLEQCGFTLKDVASGNLKTLKEKAGAIGIETLAQQAGVGVPTMTDIVEELLRPGRDPRDELPQPILRTDVMSLSDLKPDMILTGTVRNVIDFGAFVDIGVHEDGLVHISRICNRFIKHPSEALKVGDIVKVKVLEVDVKKKRISLSMRDVPQDA